MNTESSPATHKQELEYTTKKLREQLDAFKGLCGEFDGSPKTQELYESILDKGEQILFSCEAALHNC